MRACACDTASRLCVRTVVCWSAFSLVPPLGSTCSSAARAASFAGFTATMGESDFSGPFIVGFGLRPSRRGPCKTPQGRPRDIPVPEQDLSAFRNGPISAWRGGPLKCAGVCVCSPPRPRSFQPMSGGGVRATQESSRFLLLVSVLWVCGQRVCVVQAKRHIHSPPGTPLSDQRRPEGGPGGG